MPSTTTTTLAVRTPLSNEAPDGPGQILALAQDLDNYLRIGGAEYAANLTAIQAIPTARLFKGKKAYAADTDATYRYDGTTWRIWDWLGIPFATYATASNSATVDAPADGITECNIAGGLLTLNFSLTISGGVGLNVAFLQMKAGYRPSGSANFGGVTYNSSGTAVGAACRMDASGNLYVLGNGGQPLYGMRGALTYRVAN